MLPGQTIIKKCSECSGLIEESTIMSGNTFGATFWTDGKRDAPMLPDQLWHVKCPHCNTLLWIDELDKKGEVSPSGQDNPFKNTRRYKLPEFHDYISQLSNKDLDSKKENYLRFRAWWVANDKRRGAEEKQELTSVERENLQALDKLLDASDDNSRITKAEIMRELGQFEKAETLLVEPFKGGLSQAADIIRELTQSKDLYVTEMKFGD